MNNNDTLKMVFDNIRIIVIAEYTPQQQADFIDRMADVLDSLINSKIPDHLHNFVWQGATTESGEEIKDCTSEDCHATQDSSGGIINQ